MNTAYEPVRRQARMPDIAENDIERPLFTIDPECLIAIPNYLNAEPRFAEHRSDYVADIIVNEKNPHMVATCV